MTYKKTGKILALVPTYNCMNACTFCRDPKYSRSVDDTACERDTQHLQRYVDAFDGMNVNEFIIAGSDPCQLRYSLVNLVQYIYNKGYTIKNIQTHGRTFVDKALVQALASVNQGFKVIIPLYGDTKELNDAIMRPLQGSAFDDAVLAIQNCLDAGIRVDGNTRILPENRDRLDSIIQRFKEAGVTTRVNIGRVYEIEEKRDAAKNAGLIEELVQKYSGYVRDIGSGRNSGPQLIINTTRIK